MQVPIYTTQLSDQTQNLLQTLDACLLDTDVPDAITEQDRPQRRSGIGCACRLPRCSFSVFLGMLAPMNNVQSHLHNFFRNTHGRQMPDYADLHATFHADKCTVPDMAHACMTVQCDNCGAAVDGFDNAVRRFHVTGQCEALVEDGLYICIKCGMQDMDGDELYGIFFAEFVRSNYATLRTASAIIERGDLMLCCGAVPLYRRDVILLLALLSSTRKWKQALVQWMASSAHVHTYLPSVLRDAWFAPSAHFGDTLAQAVLMAYQGSAVGGVERDAEEADFCAAFVTVYCIQHGYTLEALVHDNYGTVRQLLAAHQVEHGTHTPPWALWQDKDAGTTGPTAIYRQEVLLVWSQWAVAMQQYFDVLRLQQTHTLHRIRASGVCVTHYLRVYQREV